ncbi:MAG: carbohydrate ABC transporter permease [Paracoccus sp. (in: a-proteobacteria)]|jgi:alpha-glucoside transport system permease protein|uniref:carbohydrate ABC transporter permease n=1 Tax=unclassified Paracoccus (in: a-proteobacteria) TaxID=2688777 RepID=UPI000C5B6F2A|nr:MULTISPECIES: carbohydrate ABC transporter permease [unclassified Paracoccus (in: a-proteobacteria)]MBA47436.1 ABC transporter permease [Paracoccus sp. (in: a-proteobacteria)]MCS5602088.1 carbohydrate ABC transporter permease [Paracoccus sp. (in: a-proteobacteria)]MDB2552446.1 carbohydrate ABC transporter permease [Paracoccus sp. (in: a-proteobacteria)]HIC65799.1 carbohydrate ABC transporter permease [Paracoccus sp. (in: a-proteobacteria)]|tara:strand:+ start:830 stop:1963 length:1134 start_codon:yes stop_codon:yes gene_type:complete
MDGMAGRKSSLVWAVNISALLLVILWTIPTLGLFVSSFRDRDQIASSGWWQSFSASEQTGFVRTGTDKDAEQRDGLYIIEGNVLEGGQSLVAWGTGARQPAEFQPGETTRIEDGWDLTVNEDGSYRLTSARPFDMRRGERIFVTTEAPPKFTTRNYSRVLQAEGLGRAFMNTLTVTIPATIIPILIAAFAAYALAWMEFPGRAILTAAVVGLLVVPLQVALIPLLRLHNEIGIGKGYLGIWLAHTGFGLPLAIYLLRNYMVGLPREVIESARVDGATEFQIFRRIILPLSFPALASFAIFQFLWVWNDLLVATVFLGNTREQLVMTGVLRELMGSKGGEWEILATSAFISIAVPLVVFFAMQKYLVRGLLAGSVKGG